MSEAKLLTVKELCVYLFDDFTPSLRNRVYHLLETNDVPKIKDGRNWYVNRSAVDKLIGADSDV